MNARSRLKEPGVSAALAVVLVIWALTLRATHDTRAHRVIESVDRRSCGRCGPAPVHFWISEHNGRLSATRFEASADWDFDDPSARAWVELRDRVSRSGVLAPTSQTESIGVRVNAIAQTVTWDDAKYSRTHAALAEWFEAHGEFEAASMFAAGTTNRTRLRAAGYIHNALWLIVAGVGCYSFGWLRDVGREALERQRLARGQCPTCAYPFEGLRSPVCPECGDRLPLTRTAMGSDASGPRSAAPRPSTRRQDAR